MATPPPTEITDAIIDCAYDDRPTLHSCSLTCRSWRPRAQYQIFASITLSVPHRIKRLSTALARAPHLAAHIRHVNLTTNSKDLTSFLSLGPLPQVEALTLAVAGGIGFEVGLNDDHLRRLAICFPNTRSVTFTSTLFRDLSVLLIFLQTFPRIVNMRLRDVTRVYPSSLPDPVMGRPSLLSFTLDECRHMYECWLGPHTYPLVQGLRRLRIRGDSDKSFLLEPAGAIGMLAGRVSRTLEGLEISVRGIEPAKSILLAYCTAIQPMPVLRHLRLSIGLDEQLDSDHIDADVAILLGHMRDIGWDSRTRVNVQLTAEIRHFRLEWKIVNELLARAPLPWHCTIAAPGLLYSSAHDGAAPVEV